MSFLAFLNNLFECIRMKSCVPIETVELSKSQPLFTKLMNPFTFFFLFFNFKEIPSVNNTFVENFDKAMLLSLKLNKLSA
jgi:hypothetical protein